MHVTSLGTRVEFIGIAAFLAPLKTQHHAQPRTFTLSTFDLRHVFNNDLKFTQRHHHTATNIPSESRNHPQTHSSLQIISNTKWLAEKANPLVGRQDPRRVHRISRSRTLLKLVYKSVSTFSYCWSLISVNGGRVLGASNEARTEQLPCVHWPS